MGNERVKRSPSLQWVCLDHIRVAPLAQRGIRKAFVTNLAQNMDLDALGYPVVSHRSGVYWVIDGQHRIEAMRLWAGSGQSLECEVFEDLTAAQEAEEFLQRQTRINVRPFDEFRIAVTAGRLEECEIERIVHQCGLVIAYAGKAPNTVNAVQALKFVYEKGGAGALESTLRLAFNAYGRLGLDSVTVRGIGNVLMRYGEDLLPNEVLGEKLGKIPYQDLRARANVLRMSIRRPLAECMAQAIVLALNSGRGGRKLPSWFSDE